MDNSTFILTPLPGRAWAMKDIPTVLLLPTIDDGWELIAEPKERAMLTAADIPFKTAPGMSLKSLTTIIADILQCSPSLVRSNFEYLIGTTGFMVYRHKNLNQWRLRHLVNLDDIPPINRRIIKDIAREAFPDSTHSVQVFSTRRDALEQFKQWYIVAYDTEQSRSTVQKHFHTLYQAVRSRSLR